jgi:hypothetical protein
MFVVGFAALFWVDRYSRECLCSARDSVVALRAFFLARASENKVRFCFAFSYSISKFGIAFVFMVDCSQDGVGWRSMAAVLVDMAVVIVCLH